MSEYKDARKLIERQWDSKEIKKCDILAFIEAADKEIDQLQAENERLEGLLINSEVSKHIDRQRQEIERLKEDAELKEDKP